MPKTTQQRPRIDAQGNHWEQHGTSVYQADAACHSAEDRASAAPVTVFSYRNAKRGTDAVVLLSVVRQPLRLDLDLTPESAELLIQHLQAAVQRVHEVDAVMAARGGAA